MFTVHASDDHQSASSTDSRPRVLVLDGDAASLRCLDGALGERGAIVLTATDGEAGLQLLLEELLRLDALVMDLELPGRDARALARLIRGAGNERDLALVVLADRPTLALRTELRALGVDAVVDRRDGAAAAAAAVLAANAARREETSIELEAWRCEPAAAPVGETSWWNLGALGLAPETSGILP